MRTMSADGPRADVLLRRARRRIRRYGPQEAAGVVGRGGLLVDTRPVDQRRRDGELPGALVIDRNVLEWRLDPAGAHRLPDLLGTEQEVCVVCNEGYSSSLAAANLVAMGLRNAGDLEGGFQAWRAAGMPVLPPEDGAG